MKYTAIFLAILSTAASAQQAQGNNVLRAILGRGRPVPAPATVDPAPSPAASCPDSPSFGMCCMADGDCGGGGCSCDMYSADMCDGSGSHGCCVCFNEKSGTELNTAPFLRNHLSVAGSCRDVGDCADGEACDKTDPSSCGARGQKGCCKVINDIPAPGAVPAPAPVDPAPSPAASCPDSPAFGMCCMADGDCGGDGCSCDMYSADMCDGSGGHGCCVCFNEKSGIAFV